MKKLTRKQEKIEKVMHEYGKGELNIGTSDKKVTDPKQAIAIAFSMAKKLKRK